MIARCLLFVAALGLSAFSADEKRPPFGRSSYYGEASRSAVDRAAFAHLVKRFVGRPYRTVRSKLIGLGFRPVPMRHGRAGDLCPPNSYPSPRLIYPELLACAPADFAGMSYVFRRPHDRGYAIVTTYGEEDVRVNMLRAANKGDLEDIRRYRQVRD